MKQPVMNGLVRALMAKAYSQSEAQEVYKDMLWEVERGECPEEVLCGYGLGPDYVFDLI